MAVKPLTATNAAPHDAMACNVSPPHISNISMKWRRISMWLFLIHRTGWGGGGWNMAPFLTTIESVTSYYESERAPSKAEMNEDGQVCSVSLLKYFLKTSWFPTSWIWMTIQC